MAAVDVGMRDNPPINDDHDNLFNYDVDEDIYKDVDINMDLAPKPGQPPSTGKDVLNDGLGLEQEIKVRKARQPVPKLDEKRLLSQAGIPKLRKLTKERLRFKGKGHEFSDVARLLNLYQLWLDDLYPRAKFADGLAMIEKLGHSKRMQTMRKEWIREGRANDTSRIEDEEQVAQARPRSQSLDGRPQEVGQGEPMSKLNEVNAGIPDESSNGLKAPKSRVLVDNDANGETLFLSDDEDDVDDLDAIMAEDDAARQASITQPVGKRAASPDQDDFTAEEEAMRDMDNV